MRNIGIIFAIALTTLTFNANATNVASGVEVDVSTLNPDQEDPQALIRDINKTITIAKEFLEQANQSTALMKASWDSSKRLVALCSSKDAKAYTGRPARKAYQMACATAYEDLKARSEAAASILNHMREYTPIANAYVEDGLAARQLLEELVASLDSMAALEQQLNNPIGLMDILVQNNK
jgi:hypothetical protein